MRVLFLIAVSLIEERNSGSALFLQQFWAMFLKRVLYSFRNKLLTVSQIALPLLFTILTIIVMKTLPGKNADVPSMPLNINMYGPTKVSITLCTQLADQLKNEIRQVRNCLLRIFSDHMTMTPLNSTLNFDHDTRSGYWRTFHG